jgi:hypothetical protein
MLRLFCYVLLLYTATLYGLHAKEVSQKEETKQQLTKNIVGTAKKWTILRADPNSNNVCYAILYVDDRKGNQKIEEETPYIMVHYFSEGRMRFSSYSGYDLLQDRPVHMSIDSIQYKMNVINSYAMADSALQDEKIIEHLKTAQNVLIRGEGKNYSYSIDYYSPNGFAEAFKIMQFNCSSNINNSSFETIIPQKKYLKKSPRIY